MKLIIAEKPSVAQNIAHAVGAYDKIYSDGGKTAAYYNDTYYVANAVGHLYSLGNPTDYGYQANFAASYKNGELPMFPEVFKTLPINDGNDDIRSFLNTLINKDDVTEIICATDAAREGELIFREIYNASGSNKPCLRFWTSSLTDEAIKEALANMKPLSAYDNLYRTAKLRNELDWIYGMNLTRNYTVLDDGCTHSVGRVVTPLLGIIVERDNDIARFSSVTTYKLLLNDSAVSETEYSTAAEAQAAAENSSGCDVSVQSVKRESRSENRPKLYNLSKLQQDANNILSMTAGETLAVAQSLYEKKFTTYPRTDCEVISEDMRDSISKVVDMLANAEEGAISEQAKEVQSIGLNLDKRVVNNDALTDHHAIIPTLQSALSLSSLSEKERQVYMLIANRTLMALGQKYLYDEVTYDFWCNDICYTAAVKQPSQMGWKKWDKTAKAEKDIPDYAEGQVFTPDSLTVKECTTQPPKHYTDATLISVMENIDNRMESSEYKEAVKNKGIGTSATRADVIEKLIKTGYVERKGKQLVSTQFGKDFTASLPAQVLSVERTAEWEQRFEDIERSGANGEDLYKRTKDFVANVIEYEKTNTERVKVINPNAEKKFETVTVGKCPRCGMDVIEKKDFFGCSSYKSKDEPGCGFAIWKTHRQGWFEGEITAKKAADLLEGKTITLKAKNQKGERYDAHWNLEDNGQYVNIVKAAAVKESVGKCPRCGMDVVEGKLSFSCSSYKSKDEPGCGFAIWKEDKHGGFSVTAKMARELLSPAHKTKVKKKTLNGEITQTIELVEREVNGKKYVNLNTIKE